jgi:hypothetical protein
MVKNNGFLDQDLVNRMDKAERQVKSLIKNRGTYDLMTMYHTCEDLRSELSIEAIECRRLHKPTPQFLELYKKFEKQLENLEMNLTFAALKYSHKDRA